MMEDKNHSSHLMSKSFDDKEFFYIEQSNITSLTQNIAPISTSLTERISTYQIFGN
jgi:hypothetical protein